MIATPFCAMINTFINWPKVYHILYHLAVLAIMLVSCGQTQPPANWKGVSIALNQTHYIVDYRYQTTSAESAEEMEGGQCTRPPIYV